MQFFIVPGVFSNAKNQQTATISGLLFGSEYRIRRRLVFLLLQKTTAKLPIDLWLTKHTWQSVKWLFLID